MIKHNKLAVALLVILSFVTIVGFAFLLYRGNDKLVKIYSLRAHPVTG